MQSGPALGPPRQTLFLSPQALTDHLGVQVTLACETFQHTGSFKYRGAYNTARDTDSPHLIAASSGNFGQALASACQQFGKRCTIVMPHDSAPVKIDAVRRYGATVELINVRETPRIQRVQALLAASPDAVVVYPSDGEPMLLGNESLAREILARTPAVDTIITPIGGGGIAVGCVRAVRRLGKPVNVIGVEPRTANDMVRAFQRGERFVWDTEPRTIADGARSLGVSEANWITLRSGLSAMLDVADQTTAEALRLLFSLANLKAEPTAALSLAAVLENREALSGMHVCCIVTGGNVDSARYAALLNPDGDLPP